MGTKRGGRGSPARSHRRLTPTSVAPALRWAKHNADQYIARSTLDDRGSPLTGPSIAKGQGLDRGYISKRSCLPAGESHLLLEDYQRSIRQICCSPYIETAIGVLLVGMAGSPPVVLLAGRNRSRILDPLECDAARRFQRLPLWYRGRRMSRLVRRKPLVPSSLCLVALREGFLGALMSGSTRRLPWFPRRDGRVRGTAGLAVTGSWPREACGARRGEPRCPDML